MALPVLNMLIPPQKKVEVLSLNYLGGAAKASGDVRLVTYPGGVRLLYGGVLCGSSYEIFELPETVYTPVNHETILGLGQAADVTVLMFIRANSRTVALSAVNRTGGDIPKGTTIYFNLCIP